MPSSPYRSPGSRADLDLPFRPAGSVRSFRRIGLLSRALAGSVLGHAMLLGSAAAFPSPAGEAFPAPSPRPASPDDSFRRVVHAGLDTVWSPPPPLEACFAPGEIEAARSELSAGFRHARVQSRGFESVYDWADLPLRPLIVRGVDDRRKVLDEVFHECEGAARVASGEEQGRTSVRIRMGRDREPVVSIATEDGTEVDPRLRCCLEQTGAFFVAGGALGPHAALTYEGGPGGTGAWIDPSAIP